MMKRIVIGLVVLFVLCCVVLFGLKFLWSEIKTLSQSGNKTQSSQSDPQVDKPSAEFIRVKKVVDGDTIILENGEHLRYVGIDTPEKKDPRKPVQCFAEQASMKNKELVEGKLVRFSKDVSTRDKYGRLLGYVYLQDGTFVNYELVKSGFAFASSYPPDVAKQAELKKAEAYARDNKLGLWGGCSIVQTSKGRNQTNPVK